MSLRSQIFSARSQIFIVWWAVVITLLFAVAMAALLRMLPPPDANESAAEVAERYRDNDTEILLGATLAGWTAAFMMPLWLVVGIQIARVETGRPIWALAAVVGGTLNTIVLALPPIFWGVAAFTPERSPDVTQALHQLGIFTFVSTDQWYMFNWLAVAVICLRPQREAHSPFPRWHGYFTLFVGFSFLPGAITFNFDHGPMSWNGIFIFWIPASTFFIWTFVMAYLLIKDLRLQVEEGLQEELPAPTPERV